MLNNNTFRPVVHEKKVFKGVCYINLSKYHKVVVIYDSRNFFEQTYIFLSLGCSILIIVLFGAVVLEKKNFKYFPIYHHVKG